MTALDDPDVRVPASTAAASATTPHRWRPRWRPRAITVTVFCPPAAKHGARVASPAPVSHAGRRGGLSRRCLRTAGAARDRREVEPWSVGDPSTILVQYVPTGFGLRGANIPWCRWLLERSRRTGGDVRVMFHEPYYEFTWRPLLQNALALAERLMARMLLRAASRVYLSTDAWRRYLAPHMTAETDAGARHVADSVGDSAMRSRALRSPSAARCCSGPPRIGSSAISARLALKSRRCSGPLLTQLLERRAEDCRRLRRDLAATSSCARSPAQPGASADAFTVPAESRPPRPP